MTFVLRIERSGLLGPEVLSVSGCQTLSWPLMPALAMTMSRVFVGEVVTAWLKRASWEGQERTSVWRWVQLSLYMRGCGEWWVERGRGGSGAVLSQFVHDGSGAFFGEVANRYECAVGDSATATPASFLRGGDGELGWD